MKEIHILSLGAGVQSTTVYLMAHYGMFHLDHAVFADTQDEPKTVYKHLQRLRDLNSIPIHITKKGEPLSENLLTHKSKYLEQIISIPAYTLSNDKRQHKGILRRQCTSEFKVKPFQEYVKRKLLHMQKYAHFPKDINVHLYFGISADEFRRTHGIKKRYKNYKRITCHFPLIDRWMTREDCRKWLKSKWKYQVHRSACVFCSFRSLYGWQEIKLFDKPGWKKAVQVDKALRGKSKLASRISDTLYLTPERVPIEDLDLEPPLKKELPLFIQECEGMCGT